MGEEGTGGGSEGMAVRTEGTGGGLNRMVKTRVGKARDA